METKKDFEVLGKKIISLCCENKQNQEVAYKALMLSLATYFSSFAIEKKDALETFSKFLDIAYAADEKYNRFRKDQKKPKGDKNWISTNG